MRKIVLFILIAITSILAEPGAFVRDIEFKDLNIQFPKIDRETINKNIEVYSIYSDNFPALL